MLIWKELRGLGRVVFDVAMPSDSEGKNLSQHAVLRSSAVLVA